jgi:excisionase family DNA binding protein
MDEAGGMINARDVARRYGVLPLTVAKWVREGKLTAFRPGGTGQLRFRRSDLEAFERGGGRAGRAGDGRPPEGGEGGGDPAPGDGKLYQKLRGRIREKFRHEGRFARQIGLSASGLSAKHEIPRTDKA